METTGLLFNTELAEDVRQRALQIAQCTFSLDRIEKDLVRASRTAASNASPLDPSLEAEPKEDDDRVDLADVGQWCLEQRMIQAKLVSLQAEVPQQTTSAKPGLSFDCPIGHWTLVGECRIHV
jgi:hypothetical protein